jgi:hypothetical protein
MLLFIALSRRFASLLISVRDAVAHGGLLMAMEHFSCFDNQLLHLAHSVFMYVLLSSK